MSERRVIGARVWLVPGAGFGAARGEWATIPDTLVNREVDPSPCSLDCGDDACAEWADVWTDDGRPAYHVSECQMLDAPLTIDSHPTALAQSETEPR